MSETTRVQVMRVAGAQDLPLPRPSTADSAGFDLRARVDDLLELAPGARAKVPTGIAIALPSGFEGQVRPRSGLALRHGLTLLNTPGTIDADYRGEICLVLVNLGAEVVTVRRGERLAQLVVHRLPAITVEEVESLPATDRGAGGFGHTGTR